MDETDPTAEPTTEGSQVEVEVAADAATPDAVMDEASDAALAAAADVVHEAEQAAPSGDREGYADAEPGQEDWFSTHNSPPPE